MKNILAIIILTIFTSFSCKSQQTVEDNCFFQGNVRKVFLSLRDFIIKNGKEEIQYTEEFLENGEIKRMPVHDRIKFKYDSINFLYQFVPDFIKNKDSSKINLQSIEIGVKEEYSYRILYGGFDQDITDIL